MLSVIFFVSILKDILGGFYNRKVFISFKDTIFKSSNAIRYIIKFHNIINTKYIHHTTLLILCFYTDSKLNYRYTYDSVQVALINLF